MKLRLERTAFKSMYTIGHLYDVTDGKRVYICDTIEDKNRDLNHNGKFDNGEQKVKAQTCIPFGTYKITFVKSPKFSNFTKYPYTKKYNGVMPWVRNVPHFEGILIHCGVNQNSSAGCIIVGYNRIVGRVVESQKAFYHLYDDFLTPARQRGEEIWIEIV